MMKSLVCLSLVLLPLISVVDGDLLGGWVVSDPRILDVIAKECIEGGWHQIGDVSAPSWEAIAKHAIYEHNKQSKADLVFVKIVQGRTQVVNGINYHLTIAAKNGGGTTKNYEAYVFREWSRRLTSFKAAV